MTDKTPYNKVLSALVFLTAYLTLFAQAQSGAYEPLSVGDKMPDYTFTNLINHPTATAKASDFKGRLLILDFWSTGCTSCLRSWPKLLDLQGEFEGQIQILLVNTYQDENAARQVIDRQRKIQNIEMTLPMVCGDTVLGKQLFPHGGVPYVVWIDDSGTVRSTSYGSSLNAKNINDLLNHDTHSMLQVITETIPVDFFRPLFTDGNGGDGKLIVAQSQLSKWTPGIPTTVFKLPHSNHNPDEPICCDFVTGSGLTAERANIGSAVIAISGVSIQDLFGYAYADFSKKKWPILHRARIILNVDHPENYRSRSTDGDLIVDNLYNYQYIGPPTSPKQLQRIMQTDICRYFNVDANWEKRKMKCLVLTAADTSMISYKSGNLRNSFSLTLQDNMIKLNKIPVERFIRELEGQYYSRSVYPIVDETGFNGNLGEIEMEKDFDPGNYNELNNAFQRYKMSFSLEEREVDVLVISEQ